MTVIETILHDWCEDLTDKLDAEAHLIGIASPGTLRPSFARWLVNDLHFLVGDALDTAHQGLLTTYEPAEAASVLRAETASGPGCDLMTSVFPAAATLLVDRQTAAASAIRELLHRYAEDQEALGAFGHQGPLTSIEVGLGDSHAGGRQVAMLQTVGGDRVVYKPRSHRTDSAWNQIVGLMNHLAERHTVDAIPVFDRGDYGWSSYCQIVTSPGFTDERGEQIGAVLAVLHHLSATDMHRDNLVFTQTGPAILDTETITTQPIDQLIPGDPAAMAATVLGTSAVTAWTVGADGQWSSIAPIHDLVHQGSPATNEIERRLVCIAHGYRIGTHLLARREMRAAIADLVATETRLITRRTSVYARLLGESVRGHSLRSPEARADIIAKLEPWPSRHEALVDQIVREEQACVAAGDIPRFLVTSDGIVRSHRRDLGTMGVSTSRAQHTDQQAVRADTEAQIKVLNAALRPVMLRTDHTSLTASAQRIIDDLTERLVRADGRWRAIGGVLDPLKFAAAVGPLGRGLYNGRSGVALALAASRLLTPAASEFASSLPAEHQQGMDDADHHGFVGSSSDAYAYSIACSLLRTEDPSHPGAEPSDASNPLPNTSDIIDGVAGEALSRLAAGRLAEHTASEMLTKLNDLWTGHGGHDLTNLGMAHGSLGSSFAAVRLGHYLNDGPQERTWQDRFTSASAAVAEASMAQLDHESVSWCRGMAGLVAAHLELTEIGLPSPELATWTTWLLDHHQLAVGQGLCCGAGALADVIATMRHRQVPLPSSADDTLRHWLRQPQNPRLPATQPHIGFMQGTAGTVYTLVRLIPAGRSLPSVLSFGSVPR